MLIIQTHKFLSGKAILPATHDFPIALIVAPYNGKPRIDFVAWLHTITRQPKNVYEKKHEWRTADQLRIIFQRKTYEKQYDVYIENAYLAAILIQNLRQHYRQLGYKLPDPSITMISRPLYHIDKTLLPPNLAEINFLDVEQKNQAQTLQLFKKNIIKPPSLSSNRVPAP